MVHESGLNRTSDTPQGRDTASCTKTPGFKIDSRDTTEMGKSSCCKARLI